MTVFPIPEKVARTKTICVILFATMRPGTNLVFCVLLLLPTLCHCNEDPDKSRPQWIHALILVAGVVKFIVLCLLCYFMGYCGKRKDPNRVQEMEPNNKENRQPVQIKVKVNQGQKQQNKEDEN